jgi:large subunit ribosomal protein L25
MQTVSIDVRPRHTVGTAVAKKIRRAGLIPINLYGAEFENRNVVADPKPLARALNGDFGRNQLFEVSIRGEEGSHLAIAREVQIDPISRRLRHADLVVVKPDTKISVLVPVALEGRSEGEKIGGRINFARRFIQVSCTPTTLPISVKVVMDALNIGDIVTIDDVIFPEGVTARARDRFKVLDIGVPKGGDETEEDETEEAAEPAVD